MDWYNCTIGLSILFTILKPIFLADHSGICMVIVGLLFAFVDGYVGLRIYKKKIEPLLNKLRHSFCKLIDILSN